MPLTLQWFISFTVLKHSWIHFSVQKGCILSRMASLLGQKDLSVGEGRGSDGEKHPTKTLCLTWLNTSHTTLFSPHSQLVGFPTQSNNFILSWFIFSCRKLSIHAASLALQRHRFSRDSLLYLLCFTIIAEGWRLCNFFWFAVVVTVTVVCSVYAGHHPVKEALCPALRPAPTVDLHAEECLLGWLWQGELGKRCGFAWPA